MRVETIDEENFGAPGLGTGAYRRGDRGSPQEARSLVVMSQRAGAIVSVPAALVGTHIHKLVRGFGYQCY